jgi:Nif-specific regulatory protein
MKEVFSDVHQAAPGNATILLRGESGTGKEAIAHAVHYLSGRSKGPFVKVNCAALSETLLESELFGHEKGAFTGAMTERAGRFELANGGTLFLDEIGDVSPAFQAKMLRVLQEKEFERVGGNRTIKADFRLVAATNRNLEEMVAEGDFRADLYFRINVVTIFLPALRERKEDIPLLVDFFLDRFNRENGRKLTLAPEAMDVMRHCNWPGNVRELENCIERTATMTRGSLIRDSDMRCQRNQCFSSVLLETSGKRACAPSGHMGRSPEPRERVNGSERVNGGERTNGAERLNGNDRMNGAERANGSERMNGAERAFAQSEPEPMEFVDEEYVADLGEEVVPRHNYLSERERLVAAMEKCGWVQAKAARLLNLTPRQIGYALKKYNIEVKQL